MEIKKRKKISCKDVRDQVGAESLACITPYPDDDGAFRVIKWVTYHGTVIHCDFFERHGYKFYIYERRFYILKDEKVVFRNFEGCGINEKGFAEVLYTYNKQLLVMFLHSLFSQLCILNRAAYAADIAAYDPAIATDVAAAANAAADAATAAYDAVDIRAAPASDVARAVGIYVAAAAAAVAYDATYVANPAAIAADIYTTPRRAFKKMIKLRRVLSG